jgi:hypothetical protein
MSLQLVDFWAIFDFALEEVMQLFVLMDTVVIMESPRFSWFSLMVSILFLGFVVALFNWLRSEHVGSGGSKWDYIMRRQGEDHWEAELDRLQNDYIEVGSQGLPRDRLGRGKIQKELAEMEKYNQGWNRK